MSELDFVSFDQEIISLRHGVNAAISIESKKRKKTILLFVSYIDTTLLSRAREVFLLPYRLLQFIVLGKAEFIQFRTKDYKEKNDN